MKTEKKTQPTLKIENFNMLPVKSGDEIARTPTSISTT